MDNSLFSKYQKVIKLDGDKKQIIIDLIEKTSGLKLNKEEINIKKKENYSFNFLCQKIKITFVRNKKNFRRSGIYS